MTNPVLKRFSDSVRSFCGLSRLATKRRGKLQSSVHVDNLEPRLLMTVRVWDGGGGANHDWTNKFNWQGNVAPVANDDLVFPETAPNRLTKNTFPVNATGTFRSISFAGIGYSVTGNAIRLTTSITSSSPHQEIDAPIQFIGTAAHNINVNTNSELVLNKTVSGTGTLLKQSFGRLILAGNNTFTGEFIARDGVTQLGHSNALGSTAGQTTVEFGASIELAEFIGSGEEFPRTLTIPETLVLQDADLGSVVALRNVSGVNRWTGPIKLGGGPNNDSNALPNRIGVDAAGGEFPGDQLTISGIISDPVSFSGAGFRKVGEGRLILTGSNSFRGAVSIEQGVVQMQNSLALGSPLGSTRVDSGAGLELTEVSIGGNETVQLTVNEPLQLSGNGFANAGALRNLAGSNGWQGNVTLTSNSRIGVDQEFDVLAITGLISGAGKGIIKIGSGELLLTQNNTFNSRSSSIEAGKLTVNGLQPNTILTVNGGVLQGTGTVGSVVVQAGGTISPGGTAIGTLTVNGSFLNRGQLKIDVGQSSNDLLKVNGAVNLTNAPIIINGNTPLKSVLIIQNDLTDAVQGSTNSTLVSSATGQLFKINYVGGNGNDVRLDRQNVAPMFANRLATSSIDEGDEVIVSGTIVEPDLLDTFFMTVDWGDGQLTQTQFEPGTPRDVVLTHKYLEQDNYTINLTWTDGSKHGNSGQLTTVVQNVGPTLQAGNTARVALNNRFSRRIQVTDPGLDALVTTVDYGDGSKPETLALGTSRNLQLSHRFTRRGVFRVTIQVIDNDGGIGTDSFFVIVA